MEEANDKLPADSTIIIQPKPSAILKILCILTFIWSGLSAFSNLGFTLFYDVVNQVFNQIVFPESYENAKELAMKLIQAGRLYFLLGFIMNISSIVGAYMMLRMKKQGFHFYAISQIILLMLPMIFIKGSGFPTGEFLITLPFVYMYAIQTKILERKVIKES